MGDWVSACGSCAGAGDGDGGVGGGDDSGGGQVLVGEGGCTGSGGGGGELGSVRLRAVSGDGMDGSVGEGSSRVWSVSSGSRRLDISVGESSVLVLGMGEASRDIGKLPGSSEGDDRYDELARAAFCVTDLVMCMFVGVARELGGGAVLINFLVLLLDGFFLLLIHFLFLSWGGLVGGNLLTSPCGGLQMNRLRVF